MQELSTPESQEPILPQTPADASLGRDKQTREEEADRDLTSTAVSRGTALFVCAGFLLSILVVPILDWVPIRGVAPAPVPVLHSTGPIPTAADLHDFETGLEHHSYFGNWILPRTQLLLSRALGAGDDKAYLGTGGWLYYAPDVDYVTGPGFLDPEQLGKRSEAGVDGDPLPALIRFQRQLASRGIKLIVMPVPVKPMIDPEGLGVTPASVLQNSSYAQFERRLRSSGIAVCDVSTALAARRTSLHEPQFLKTDTHWTPDAMQTAASTLARAVEASVRPAASAVRYASVDRTVTNSGDIAKMLRAPLAPEETVDERQILTSSGTAWQADPGARVLLLGDSFSNIYSDPGLGWGSSAGLAEQLSFLLGRPVDKIALNAGGSYGSRKALSDSLQRGEDRLAGKRVVVYEFAMRDLSSGDWKPLDFTPRSMSPGATITGTRQVECRILDIAQAPDPRQTVYPDCLIEMRLRAMGASTETLLAYAWGLKGGAYTEAAGLRPGATAMFTISPWRTVEPRVGSVSRSISTMPMSPRRFTGRKSAAIRPARSGPVATLDRLRLNPSPVRRQRRRTPSRSGLSPISDAKSRPPTPKACKRFAANRGGFSTSPTRGTPRRESSGGRTGGKRARRSTIWRPTRLPPSSTSRRS